jgi:hypothetical protein
MQETIKNTFSQIMLTQALLSKTRDPNGRPYFRLTGQIFGRADGQDSRAFRDALANYHRDHGKAPILPRVDPAWRGLAVTNSTQPQLFVARRLVAAGDGSGEAAAMGLPGDYERTVRDAAIAIQGVLNSQVLIANPGLGGGGHKGLIGRGAGMDGFLVQPLRFMDIVWLDRNLEALDNIAVPERVLAEFNAALNADQAVRAAGLSVRAGAAGAANPLQLITAQAIFLKGSHRPSPAPGPHRLISGPVGSDGAGHDIAAVKAALRLIAMAGDSDNNSNGGGGGTPFWPGAIDGRGGGALARAISEFHSQVGLGEVSTVTPTSPGEAELQKYLPAEYKHLQGLPGSSLPIVRLSKIERPGKVPMPEAGALTGPVQANAQLMRELGRLVDIVWDRSGMVLKISGISQSPEGAAIFTLDLDRVRFLDSNQALLAEGKVPPGFYDYLQDLLREDLETLSAIRWHDSAQTAVPQVISRDALFAVTRVAAEKVTDPTQIFQDQPAKVPAGHHLLEATIQGKRATGKPHDLAALQAALKLIVRPDSGGPFFTATIDGKGTDSLAQALQAFQAASRLPVTAQVLQGDETEAQLIGRLPAGYRYLRGLPHTNVAIVAAPLMRAPGLPEMGMGYQRLLNEAQKQDLSDRKNTGLSVSLRNIIGQNGGFGRVELALASHIETLQPATARPIPMVQSPDALGDFIRKSGMDVASFRYPPDHQPLLQTTHILAFGEMRFQTKIEEESLYIVELDRYLKENFYFSLSAGGDAALELLKLTPRILADMEVRGKAMVADVGGKAVAVVSGPRGQQIGAKLLRHTTIPPQYLTLVDGVFESGKKIINATGFSIAISASIGVMKLVFEDQKFHEFVAELGWDIFKTGTIALLAPRIMRYMTRGTRIVGRVVPNKLGEIALVIAMEIGANYTDEFFGIDEFMKGVSLQLFKRIETEYDSDHPVSPDFEISEIDP